MRLRHGQPLGGLRSLKAASGVRSVAFRTRAVLVFNISGGFTLSSLRNSPHQHFFVSILYISTLWCIVCIPPQQPDRVCPAPCIFKLYIIWMSLCLENKDILFDLRLSLLSSVHTGALILMQASSPPPLFALRGNRDEPNECQPCWGLPGVPVCSGMKLRRHIQRNTGSIHMTGPLAFTSDLTQDKGC